MPLTRHLAPSAIVLAASLALTACTEARPAPEDALRRGFPGEAARILDRGAPFAAARDGFALAAEEGSRALEAQLPRDGSSEIHLRLANGFDARVREIGAAGNGAVAGAAVVYRRDGGASFWTAAEGGVEEWLLLDPGVAVADRAAAAWEIEGAVAVEREGAIELDDLEGNARVRVTAPEAFAAGGRPIEARLRVRAGRVELVADAGGEAALVDPAWVAAATMSAARYTHTATILPGGSVLVAGGAAQGASAERYDPLPDAWTAAGAMVTARAVHTATWIPPQSVVLVAGGLVTGQPANLAEVEVYAPANNQWTPAPPMSGGRAYHTATWIPSSGEVIVVGGDSGGGSLTASVERFVLASNAWAAAPPLTIARRDHTATHLPGSDAVLVTGGFNGAALSSVEIYDVALGTWAQGPAMSVARRAHTATLLADGRVLVAGGSLIAPTSAEIYDPVSAVWSQAAPMIHPRGQHTATLLATGEVLIAAGFDGADLASAEIYHPLTNTWTDGGALAAARRLHTATLLGSGKVLVAGGLQTQGFTALASAALFSQSALGKPCGGGAECQSGFCADGVCCDKACAGGPCDACSVAAGAAVDGTCAPLDGAACEDGSACTTGDKCSGGLCKIGSPVICAADACHVAGACDPATGCAGLAKPDGTACDDASSCTSMDACKAGVCAGALTCTAKPCEIVSGCDQAQGKCILTSKPDGAPCAGGTCFAGTCLNDPDAGTSASSSSSAGAGGAGGNGPDLSGAGGDITGGAQGTIAGGCSTGGGAGRDAAWAAVALAAWIAARRRRARDATLPARNAARWRS